MTTFPNFQNFGKEGVEAFVASATALTKGYQTIAQELADYSRKSAELTAEAFEKAVSAKSVERVVEVQQGYAKSAYEAYVAQATKLGELYTAAAKEAYKPFEASFGSFGIKSAQ